MYGPNGSLVQPVAPGTSHVQDQSWPVILRRIQFCTNMEIPYRFIVVPYMGLEKNYFQLLRSTCSIIVATKRLVVVVRI